MSTQTKPKPLTCDLERYYRTKLESLHFFGAANFQMSFWDGLELLALTFPLFLFIARAFKGMAPPDAIERALTIADDHLGFHRALVSPQQKASLRILSRTGELPKLIAWYGRDKGSPETASGDMAS